MTHRKFPPFSAWIRPSLLAVSVLLGAACGGNEPGRPAPATGLRVQVAAAPRGDDAPVVGPVDSIRVDLRGPGGELIVHPSLIEVAPGQTTFSLSMEALPGQDRNITVMAIGSRPVLGGSAGESGRGILHHGRTSGIDIIAGRIPTIPVSLDIFVPAFLPPEENGSGGGHLVRWNPVPGADRYLLTRIGSRGERVESTVLGASFTGDVRPMRYQVRSVDFSGLVSAPSDYLLVGAIELLLLCVEPASIDLGVSGTSGGFTLTNCGTGGALDWSVIDDQPWLTVTPGSGSTTTETENLTVQADRSGLAPGSHSAIVTIQSTAGPATVDVTLVVEPMPMLCVGTATLDLGSTGALGTVHVTNCGTGGTLEWSASDNQPWIIVDPGSGSTTLEQDAVTISVNRSGLAPGAHQGLVNFSSNGGAAAVEIRIEVAALPVACVAPPSLDFGSSATSLSFFVDNCGTGGVLSWSVDDDQPWLTLAPAGGTTTNEEDVVTVMVNRAGRAAGTYNGLISFVSNGGDRTVAVSMIIPVVPALCVSPGELDFGPVATSRTVFITNCGGGTLDWALVGNAPWIGVSGARSGSTTMETDSVAIVVDRTGLAPGFYSGAITVTAGSQVTTLPVTMTVAETPQLCVLPGSLDFGLTSSQSSFQITNCGTGGTLNWSLQADQPWIGAGPASGNTTETDGVTVTVNRTGLGPGAHTGKITISSNGGTETVDVSLMVSAEPVLCVEPASLNFGLTTIHLTFNLSNCGLGGVLSWSAEGNQSWMQVTPGEGTTATETDIVTVSVGRAELQGGAYAGTVYVTSNGGVDSIQVTMQVPITPALCVSKSFIDFGLSATQDGFSITNCGTGGTLSWDVNDDRPWITVTPPLGTTTTAASGVTVIVSRSGLTTGTHTGTVTVSSNGGTANISISLQVPATAALCANPDALNLGFSSTQASFNITNCGSGGTLEWSIEHEVPWMFVTPDHGTITTGTALITVSVARTNLLPGTYRGDLQVMSNAGAASLPVVMEVPGIPAAPSALKATPDPNVGTIHLTWTDNSSNEAGFVVERRSGTAGFVVRATLPPNSTGYSDAVDCNRYSYRVRAFTAAGHSEYSNETPFVSSNDCSDAE